MNLEFSVLAVLTGAVWCKRVHETHWHPELHCWMVAFFQSTFNDAGSWSSPWRHGFIPQCSCLWMTQQPSFLPLSFTLAVSPLKRSLFSSPSRSSFWEQLSAVSVHFSMLACFKKRLELKECSRLSPSDDSLYLIPFFDWGNLSLGNLG